MIPSKLETEAAKQRLRDKMRNAFSPRLYRTGDAVIESVSRDQYGRSYSATVTVDGVTGYSMKMYGADVGVGDRVEVYNASGEPAAPDYQLVGVTPGSATETRRIGGNSYDGLDLLNLAALRVQQDGYIVVGGAIDGSGNPQGERVELRNYGVLGYATGGNELSFGLFTGDYTWEQEDGTEWQFNRGDIHLGLLSSGHLLIDNPAGKFKWMVGDKEVFESRFWNGNPITTLQGWLWVGPYDDSAPGISIGREPGDSAFLFRMYNKFGVPLINFAAGTPDDPYEAYVRIGPPKPFPGLTIDSDSNGNPRLTLDGGTIIAGTMRADSFESNTLSGAALQDLSVAGSKIAYKAITADKIQVGHLSAIVADMGLLTAGEIRVGTGTVGSDFTGLRLYDTGASAYALAGYNSNVEQAKFDTDGTITWGAGAGVLDDDSIRFVSGNKRFTVSLTDIADRILEIQQDEASGYGIKAAHTNGGIALTASSAYNGLLGVVYGLSTGSGAGVSGKSSSGAGVYGLSDTGPGVFGQGTGSSAGGVFQNIGGSDAIVTGAILRGNPSLAVDHNYGIGLAYELDTKSGGVVGAGRVDVYWVDADNADYTSNMLFSVANDAVLDDYMRLTSVGLGIGWNEEEDINGIIALTPASRLHVVESDSATNAVSTVPTWGHNSSGTPAAGFGLRHLFQLHSSTTVNQDAAAMDALWTTATHASRTAALRWLLVNNAGALAEFMRLTPTELELQGNLKVQGKPAFDPGATLTIATGAITVTAGFHFVDTESSAASDDLDTINGGVDGMVLVLRANTSARTVVCKDGSGNLQLAGDFSLDNTQDSITLMFYSTSWFELSRSDNGA